MTILVDDVQLAAAQGVDHIWTTLVCLCGGIRFVQDLHDVCMHSGAYGGAGFVLGELADFAGPRVGGDEG